MPEFVTSIPTDTAAGGITATELAAVLKHARVQHRIPIWATVRVTPLHDVDRTQIAFRWEDHE